MADKFTQIISRASNRMLGGKPLSRNAEWTATSINFTTDTWLASQSLKKIHPALRPFAQFFLPEMAKVRAHGAVSRRVINPMIEQRLRTGERPLDLLQMLWDGAEGPDKTPDFMAYTALAISFAAIRTSSSVPTHLLYDLCARPQYIEPLRQEIESVLAEEGALPKAALNKLVLLDSFMKESQRFNPLSFRTCVRILKFSSLPKLCSHTLIFRELLTHGYAIVTFGRLLHHPLTLSSNITIPAGTIIGVPAYAIAHDQAFFPSPSDFRPFRFVPDHPSSSSSSSGGTAQFVTTNASNLMWGYGKHACSGRFFAAAEIKLIFAHFLRNYDFKFKKLEEESTRPRPANLAFELQSMADPSVEILLRRRQGE